MSDTFISRTGRRMPVPTRAAYYSSARRLERNATNAARLRAARNHFGAVLLRVVPQVRLAPDRPDQYGALLGEAVTVRFDEAIDVMDFWRDVLRFMRAWRPMRRRTMAAQQAVARVLDTWDRLAAEVR